MKTFPPRASAVKPRLRLIRRETAVLNGPAKNQIMGKGNSLQDRSAAKGCTSSGQLTFAARLDSPNSLRPYEQSDELDCRGRNGRWLQYT
jgi:hypothetical protein